MGRALAQLPKPWRGSAAPAPRPSAPGSCGAAARPGCSRRDTPPAPARGPEAGAVPGPRPPPHWTSSRRLFGDRCPRQASAPAAVPVPLRPPRRTAAPAALLACAPPAPRLFRAPSPPPRGRRAPWARRCEGAAGGGAARNSRLRGPRSCSPSRASKIACAILEPPPPQPPQPPREPKRGYASIVGAAAMAGLGPPGGAREPPPSPRPPHPATAGGTPASLGSRFSPRWRSVWRLRAPSPPPWRTSMGRAHGTLPPCYLNHSPDQTPHRHPDPAPIPTLQHQLQLTRTTRLCHKDSSKPQLGDPGSTPCHRLPSRGSPHLSPPPVSPRVTSHHCLGLIRAAE